MCGPLRTALVSATLAWSQPVFAQAADAPLQTVDGAGDSQTIQTKSPTAFVPPTFTGEWGGIRTRLRDGGVDLTANYGSETAWNPSGGTEHRIAETGQFVFGTTFDTQKLFGLAGGTFQATVTYRRGSNLDAIAGIDVLQQVQEVYGRGQTWRLTQFWYQQGFATGHVDIKAGRLTQGEDFASFSCVFMNLSFCGAPPGNLAGDYWYNWPVSQWGARARLRIDSYYVMLGAYEVNPNNLDNTFVLGHFHGATGVMVPLEFGFTPSHGLSGLPGSYKVGGCYNTSKADDVYLDINDQPRAITGLAPLRRTGRYGVYAQFQQQLTGTSTDGPGGTPVVHGLTAFLNITQTDRRTTATDNQIAGGFFYTGLFPGRQADDFELGLARTNVNARSISPLLNTAARPDAEYAAEIAYGLHATGWLILRPNVQYIVDPGGYSHVTNVVIIGLKGSIQF